MLKKTLKELSGHSIIYSLVYMASSATSILLMPVYTRFLSKADYGILEILDYTNTILMIIMVAGLNAAIPKFYHESDNAEEKKKVVSTAVIFAVFVGITVTWLGIANSEFLSTLILGTPNYRNLIDLSIILLFMQMLVYVSGINFIAAKKSKPYLLYMLIKLVLAISANLYFIVVLRMGVIGMLYGNLLANGLVAIAITGFTFFSNGFSISLSFLKKMLKFGAPLVPAALMGTIMHNADRFLIRYYCTLEDVGIYSIGYKFPFMMNLLIMQSFSMIWTGATMYEISKQPDSAYQYGRITTYVISLYVFAQVSLSIFSVSIVRILVDEKFFAAHQVVPLVALGLCFHAFYFFFSVGTFLKKKTWLVNVAYLPAAMVNIAGNMILLPMYGFMAAAWVTTATYFVFCVIIYFTCKRLISIRYEAKRLTSIFLIGITVFYLSSLFRFNSLLMEMLKSSAFILLFIGIIGFCGWFTQGEKEHLTGKLNGFIMVLFKIKSQKGA